MKKILSIALVILMIVSSALCFSSCGNKETIVMGFDAEYPPFTYEENGEFVGFDVEFAKKVVEDTLGYKLELKPIDWNAKDESLSTGAIDCIWSGFTYEERENDYAWTVRYLNNTIVVLTNCADVTTLASLADKTVAVQSDSSGETAINSEANAALVASFKDGEVKTEASYTMAFTKLKAGAYDAIIVDIGVANYLLANGETDSTYKILDDAISVETYGVGFRKDDTELCKAVSDAMETVGQDADFIKGLCEKYGVEYTSFTLGK